MNFGNLQGKLDVIDRLIGRREEEMGCVRGKRGGEENATINLLQLFAFIRN